LRASFASHELTIRRCVRVERGARFLQRLQDDLLVLRKRRIGECAGRPHLPAQTRPVERVPNQARGNEPGPGRRLGEPTEAPRNQTDCSGDIDARKQVGARDSRTSSGCRHSEFGCGDVGSTTE